MRISIFGLGYVGAVSMACLARDGHQLVGVDVDPNKLELIRSGRSPIVEEGIQELTKQVVADGRVTVTNHAGEAILATELSFVCVGTPSSPNGSQDLGAIQRLAEQIGVALKNKDAHHVVVIRSTVRPGTVEDLIQPIIEKHSGKQAGREFSLCFQPEFLREGTSIKDYDRPPFTIVGVSDERAAAALRTLFGHLPCEFITTSIRSAEMMKYACNAFHAVKVAFANEIGRISQGVGVDPHEVMRLVCLDKQLNISPAYLRPGYAFGGSCLPKDLKALLYMAKMQDVNLPMLGAVLPSNRVHIDHAIDYVLAQGKRRVTMAGLSFKAGTDDLRESPLVTLAERLIGKGLQLKIYDPEVNLSRLMGANKRYIEESIPHIAQVMTDNIASAVRDSDVVVVGLKTADVLQALEQELKPEQKLLDLVMLPNRSALRAHYRGMCW
jgi:GDP-mannose 6-dehydrogenase